jgi:prophage regulatory protein
MQLLKKEKVLSRMAFSNSTLYARIKFDLMTPPVVLGANSVAWPEHEIFAINAARIAGKSDHEIRALVTELVSLRKSVSGKSESELRTTIFNLIGGA